MNPWKLIPLPYRVLIVVAIAAAVFGGFFAWGYQWSSNAWALKYIERENELLERSAKDASRIREIEQALAERMVDIDAAYQKGVNDAHAETERTIADLRAGNLRLRRELAASACRVSGIAAASGSSDGRADPELWRAAAEDLVRLAADADGIVIQLQACQAVVGRLQPRSSKRQTP